MQLNTKQQKFLRSQAHNLKPVVIIGNAGLTDGVLNEIEERIEHHELIKVRINASDKDDRQSMVDRICRTVHAAHVTTIGHIAVFYRPAKKPTIKLP